MRWNVSDDFSWGHKSFLGLKARSEGTLTVGHKWTKCKLRPSQQYYAAAEKAGM